jgi:outer membrane lipoprotein-sorting protein
MRQSGAMTTTRRWDRAADLPAVAGRRPRPELVALPADELPTVAELFTFMRDAELRFESLRMRIEERTFGVAGEQVALIDVVMRHPDHAKVTTTVPGPAARSSYAIWISDGATVRTYSGGHRLGTERPVRRQVVGVSGPGSRDLPGPSRVYDPRTGLPMETLPEPVTHPAGYCQNVLSTGACAIVGLDDVGGREAIVVECDHPRTIEMTADRPDFRIRLAVDRADGVILRLEESIGGRVTRDARVVEYAPDSPLSPNAFDFTFPTGTTMLF